MEVQPVVLLVGLLKVRSLLYLVIIKLPLQLTCLLQPLPLLPQPQFFRMQRLLHTCTLYYKHHNLYTGVEKYSDFTVVKVAIPQCRNIWM